MSIHEIPHRLRLHLALAIDGLGLLAMLGCGSTSTAPAHVSLPDVAAAAPPVAVQQPEVRAIQNALLTSPLFSPDGRFLLLGDLATPRLIMVVLETSEFGQRTLPFSPSVLELSPDGRFLYAAGRGEADTGGIARVDLASWETMIAELPEVRRVTDLAVEPGGERVFVGDAECNCLYDMSISALFGEDLATPGRSETRRIYLESGPASEIELLVGGNRVLVLHLEGNELVGKGYRRQAGAELSLIDTKRGGLVDRYWSQMGLGTGSILTIPAGPLPSRFVVAVEEDPRRTIVSYEVEDEGEDLESRATTIATSPPTSRPLNGQLRLVGSADRETLVVLTPDERDLQVIRVDLSDDDAPELVRQWSLRAPRHAEDAALTPDGKLLAVTSADRIVLYPLTDD